MANTSNKYHYFYKITNNINSHFYYGVHNTNNLDDGYMGSGTRLHYAYKKYGIENFTKEILKFFDTSKEAFEYEAEVVNEDLIKDTNCYNIQLGGDGWNTTGLITVKDKDGNCFDVTSDDPRYLSGELVGITKGTVTVKDINGNNYKVSLDDPRYLSGELVGITKGMSLYKDEYGNRVFSYTDDERIKDGKLISYFKNKILVKDKNNHHFYQIDKNDSRYLSGELILFWKDKKHKESTKEKMRLTHKMNKHQQGEKNSQYGTCWIHNDVENKKIKKEDLEKYISNGWVKGRKMKFN